MFLTVSLPVSIAAVILKTFQMGRMEGESSDPCSVHFSTCTLAKT